MTRHTCPTPRPAVLPAALALAAAACALLAAPLRAQSVVGEEVPGLAAATGPPVRPKGGWLVEWTPYLWASGLDGNVGIRGQSVHVDLGFSEIVDNLDGALFLPVEMRKGRWGTAIELMLVKLSDQRAVSREVVDEVQVTSHQTLVDLSLRYRPIAGPKPVSVDLIAGARFWQLSNRLTFITSRDRERIVEAGDNWTDPFIGARIMGTPWRRVSILGRGDIGGFDVGSRLTWQLLGAVGYLVGDRVTFRAGYRYLDVDFEDDDTGFIYDIAMRGWIAGITVAP